MLSREKLKTERNFDFVTQSKNKDMKEGDLILVSAEATGLGKPMEAIIDKIETFMGQTLVTVTYTQPDALSGFGGCFVDSHITLSEKKGQVT